ncbi:hypothetical protein D3C87_1852010 [compost metagenome]
MADQAEGAESELVGKRQRVEGDLVDRVRAARRTPAAIAAVVHEHIAVGVLREPRLDRLERTGVAEPAVQDEDGVGARPHAMKSTRHIASDA